MSKPNGHDHDPDEVHTENHGSARVRKSRERKKLGVVVLRDITIAPELVDAMAQFGWLLGAKDAAAVKDAIGAITYAALNAGLRPTAAGKVLLPVDLRAIEAAKPWLRPGEAVTAESAGRALGAAVKCGEQVGFTPREYGERVMAMAGIEQ